MSQKVYSQDFTSTFLLDLFHLVSGRVSIRQLGPKDSNKTHNQIKFSEKFARFFNFRTHEWQNSNKELMSGKHGTHEWSNCQNGTHEIPNF